MIEERGGGVYDAGNQRMLTTNSPFLFNNPKKYTTHFLLAPGNVRRKTHCSSAQQDHGENVKCIISKQTQEELPPHPEEMSTLVVLPLRQNEGAPKLSAPHSSYHTKKRKHNHAYATYREGDRKKISRSSNFPTGVPKVRKWLPLGLDRDSSRLSAFLCFLRSECVEVFVSNKADVIERMTSKKIKEGQVGVRCRFCAHLSQKNRVGRSSNFPSSISQIYPGISMMIYKHFAFCPEMPLNLREKFNQSKNLTKQGNAGETRTYWSDSAKQLGMVDIVENFHHVQMDPRRLLHHHSMKENF